MKVLILGSKGMLGQALAEVFSVYEPLCMDQEELDITDADTVIKILSAVRPNLIINAAAMTDVDGCEDRPKLAMTVNAKAVKHLASAAKTLGAILVQFSTEYVFDGANLDGYKEDAKPAPLSVYGASKLAGELAAAQAGKFYIIRLSRLFGKPGGGKQSFVDKILAKVKDGQPARVIDEEVSCPTYAPDLAGFTRRLIESGAAYGIYHGANTGACTWYGFAREIFKIAGIGVELIPVPAAAFPRRAKIPKFAQLLNTKMPPQRGWQEGLKEYLKL